MSGPGFIDFLRRWTPIVQRFLTEHPEYVGRDMEGCIAMYAWLGWITDAQHRRMQALMARGEFMAPQVWSRARRDLEARGVVRRPEHQARLLEGQAEEARQHFEH